MTFADVVAKGELAATTMNRVAQGVPTTQVQVIVGGWLAFGTFLLYAVLAVRGTAIDGVAFGLWLGFVAACLGIAYKQFHAKRTTDYGYLERTGAAVEGGKESPKAPVTASTNG